MRWRTGFLVALLPFAVAIVLHGCGKNEPLLTDHPGFDVYGKHCRRCHGDHGDGVRASRMARRRVDLGSAAYRDTTSVEKILAVIGEGKGRMKGYREQLSPEDFQTVVAYVLALPEGRRAEGNH